MLCVRWIVLSFCILLFTSILKANECQQEDPNVSDIKEISCAITDLWMAMANEQLSKVIANSSFFVEYQEGDIVRAEKLVLQLENAITDTHRQYQIENSTKRDYTFSVTTYPAEVKEGTCKGSSTIQKRELSKNPSQPVQEGNVQTSSAQTTNNRPAVFVDYSAIEGKEPRYFQLRKKENGKLVVCEKSTLSREERIALFCESDEKCTQSLPVSCDQLDQRQTNITSACVFTKETKPVIRDFLGAKLSAQPNVSLEYKFCPEDCSFYTQTLQKVRKIEETDQYCTENYLIVHCGSKADSPSIFQGGPIKRKFNLNIREVDDFCEDFNMVCRRVGQIEEESPNDLSEEEFPEETVTESDEDIDLPKEEFPEESSTEPDDGSADLSPVDEVPESPAEEETSVKEEETSAQPIDDILEKKPRDNWMRGLWKVLRGKKRN